jgi:hypothetical protein
VGNQTGVVLIADLSRPPKRGQTPLGRRVELLSHLARVLGPAVKGVVRYSETAWLASTADVDEHEIDDSGHGSNLQHALLVARDACNESGADRMVVVVSSFPSAHILLGGEVFFNYPPVLGTFLATTDEATLLASDGVRLDAVVLGDFSGVVATNAYKDHTCLVPDGPPAFHLVNESWSEKLSESMARMTGPTGGVVMTASDDEPVEAVVGRFVTQSQLVY